jgi:hypothetical protein
MNTAAVKYRLYKQMLEGNISRSQHDMLLELGFLDKIKAFLGGGVDVGRDLGNLFKDKANQKMFATAKDNITKAVKDLQGIASKAGVGDDAVKEFLQGVLTGAGVNPAEIARAEPSGGEGGGTQAGKGGGPKPGTPVDPGKPETAVPAITQAAAQLAGADPAKAQEDAKAKKVTPEKATEVLAKSVAKAADVEPKAALAVIQALLKGGHLVREGRYRPTLSDFRRAIHELNQSTQPGFIFERWQHLAGVTLLTEGRTDNLIKDIESKKVTKAADLMTQIDAIMKGGDKGKYLLKNINKVKAAFENASPDEAKNVKWDQITPAGGDAKEDAKAEEAKKKFGGAFDAVKTAVGDAADDVVIGKVLAALDDLDSLKVS